MNKGKLFYVVGASGAGKDSLMDYARKNIDEHSVKFASRHITRPADSGGEDHIAVTHEQFAALKRSSEFVLYWESHGNWYGVHKEIDAWLVDGINVVVNGSRGYLPTALEKYPDLRTILVEVSESVMRERLKKRGRESEEEIEKRIERSKSFQNFKAPNMIRIDNDQPLHISGAKFISCINHTSAKTLSV